MRDPKRSGTRVRESVCSELLGAKSEPDTPMRDSIWPYQIQYQSEWSDILPVATLVGLTRAGLGSAPHTMYLYIFRPL